MHSAKNLILLGDPSQLQQPQQAAHPEGSDISALSHYMKSAETMDASQGIFLDETWRMHPSLTAFTSEQYYQNRLRSRPGLDQHRFEGSTLLPHAGLYYLPVEHQQNRSTCMEEVDVIRDLVHTLLKEKITWHEFEEKPRLLTAADVKIVAPFNAQVDALRRALPMLADNIGTVDRFQGSEAPILIYSTTSSSAEDAPRGISFLYDPHRFNVASSRAKYAFIMVGSPSLFSARCTTPKQVREVNGFCRYLELAEKIEWSCQSYNTRGIEPVLQNKN